MIISNTNTQGGINNSSQILPNSFYGNQTSNPFTQQALASTQSQPSVVLCSREDHSRFIKDLESKNRQERVKLVRAQEKQASRALIQETLQKQQQVLAQEQERAQYQEYLEKKREIERLRELRELEIARQGQAMRDAEEREEARLREALAMKQKAIREEEARRGRGKEAVERERRLREEQRQIEEEIKQIERKRMVATQEQQIAREAAQKYREQQSVWEESKMQQSSKVAVAAEISTLKSVSHVDYTNTRFHNAVVVKNDQFMQNELEKLKKGAYDKAKEEQTKKSIMKAQKENQNRINSQKAQERGKKALYEQISKKDKELFEKEMQKLQIQENLQKIQEAKRGEEPAAMTVMQERKEKQKQEKMMKMFEEEVIIKEPRKSKSRERLQSADNTHHLRQKQQPAIVIKVEEDNQRNQNELQIEEQARNIMEIRQQHQPSMFSNFDHIRTYNEMGLSSQSINQSNVNQTTSGAYQLINRPQIISGSDFTIPEASDFNQRANNYYSPSSDVNRSQHHPFPNPQPDRSQLPSSSQQSSNTNLLSTSNQHAHSQNPFFVPTPSQQPRIAPTHHNALPQYFNPYIQQQQQQTQILDQEQPVIKIALNHPKQQMTNVDEFLQDNQEYLQKEEQEDSENPDEYDDEEESSMTDENNDVTSSSGSSMTSIVQSPSGQQSIEGAYRMEQIDRIIREARQNKKEMLQQKLQQEDSSSASELSESFDDKYLKKYSAMSHNQPQIQSNLADEFLNDHDSSLQLSSQQPYQSDLLTKSSYLKQSVPQQISTLDQNQQRPIFDYGAVAHSKHQFKITSGQVDLHDNAPMSELSYSYSEMPGGIHQFGQQSGMTLNQSRGAPFQSTQTRDNNPMKSKGGVKLEIVDAANDSSNQTDQSQKSLAEIFRERRGLQKDESNEERPKERKPEKTKEELAQIRKQMMKARPSQQSNQSLSSSSGQAVIASNAPESIDSAKFSKNAELMSRLARGEKVEVSKKDMLKLTNKNYEQLPEVKKKKEEERKKEEMKERMKQVKELERQRRELRSAGSSNRQNSQRK